MTGLYGEKWINQYGEWSQTNPTVPIWGAALKGLDDEQLKRGLNAVCNNGSPFVPTAPEFKKLCIDDGVHWEHKAFEIQALETDRLLSLPKPEIDKSVGREHLAKFKEGLK